jgi:hypothetical protein
MKRRDVLMLAESATKKNLTKLSIPLPYGLLRSG